MNLTHSISLGSGGFFGGPSLAAVKEARQSQDLEDRLPAWTSHQEECNLLNLEAFSPRLNLSRSSVAGYGSC